MCAAVTHSYRYRYRYSLRYSLSYRYIYDSYFVPGEKGVCGRSCCFGIRLDLISLSFTYCHNEGCHRVVRLGSL